MRAIVLLEFAFGIVGTVAFLVGFGPPWRALDRAMAWHIASFSCVTGVELFGLLLLGLRVPVPAWIFAIVYALIDVVIGWRLGLLIAARDRESV